LFKFPDPSLGDNVGLSFYAFFKNKNDNPELLMEAAHWWIMRHKLDHFEKAVKIRQLILGESQLLEMHQKNI